MYKTAIDTETYQGSIKCLCDVEKCIEPGNIEEVLRFLRRKQNTIYFCFNLRFDVQSIIKMLPRENIIELGTKDMHKTKYGDFFLTYIPKKKFSIRKGRGAVHIFDIAQFYQGMSLDAAAQKYLGDSKSATELGINRQRIGSEKGYYEQNRGNIMEYCKKDAWLTKNLVLFMENTFAKIEFEGNEPAVNFDRPISVASIAEKWMSQRSVKYPRVLRFMQENGWYLAAQEAYRGGRFSTLQRGNFDMSLYDYDLNSAYPATMITLPNWSDGSFEIIDVTEKMDYRDAEYAWMLVEFDCPHIPYVSSTNWEWDEIICKEDGKLVEMKVIAPNKRIYYPTGKRTRWLTKLDIDFLDRNGYSYQIKYGVGWQRKTNKYENPFGWMEEFYKKRQIIKKGGDFAVQYAMKIFMNSLYGKTVQKTGNRFRGMQNFFYGSYITSDCRNKVNQVYEDNPDTVVNIATDGVLSTEKISGLRLSDKLGEWGYRKYDKGIILGNGMRQLWNADGSYVTYARGLTDKKDWDMRKVLEEHLTDSEITFTSYRPIQLGEILNFTKVFEFSDLNRFMERKRKLRVNADTTRGWEREFSSFRDMLNSEPIRGKPKKVEDC